MKGYARMHFLEVFAVSYKHLDVYKRQDVRHADKAMEILRGYASTLQKIYGPDDPLCAGLQGFMLINAAEIMRYTYQDNQYVKGWSEADTKSIEGMFRNEMCIRDRFMVPELRMEW